MAAGEKKHSAGSEEPLHQAIPRLLAQSASPTDALARAAGFLAARTLAEAVQISATTNDDGRVVEIHSSGILASLFPTGLKRPSHGSSMRMIANRGPLSFSKDDLQYGSQHGVEDFSVFMAAGFSRLVAAPIHMHGVNLGAVQLLSSSPLQEDSLDVLEEAVPMLAPYVALFMATIENATGERISLSIERVAEAVIQESGIEGVCDAVVKFAKGSMGIDAVVVRILDSAGSVLRIEYRHGHVDPANIAGDAFQTVEKKLVPMAVARGASLIVDEGSPEVFNDPELTPLIETLPSILVTPLLDKGELLGTIEFYSLNEYAYKADHLRNVEHVANLLTSAVAHFRLIRSLSREAEIRGLLAEVARLASAADDLTSLVTSISPELKRVIPVDRVTYFMPSEHVSPDRGAGGEEDTEANGPDALARVVITGHGYVVCHGADEDGASRGVCGADNCAAAMLWELAEDRLQGWIHLERVGEPFTKEERSLISEFARHISPAIDTALSHRVQLRLADERLRAERAEAEVKQQLQINEAKQNFIATMSHELRTPLTSIRAFADLLNRNSGGTLSDKQKKQLSVVRRNSEWLNILINDLLDLSSIDSGRFEVQYQDVDISALVPTVLESFGPIAETADHELRAILPGRPVRMSIDPNRFSQVLGNLLTNAIKFSPSGTRIRLLTRPVNGGVAFFVRDEGPGIPLDEQKSVFDRFVRAKSEASKKARGTGVGLYVSKMIVESHGGYIGVTSVLDDHTTMYFWLPCKRPESADEAEHEGPGGSGDSGGSGEPVNSSSRKVA